MPQDQENVTYTIVVPKDVDDLVRCRWPQPEKYLAGLIASNATDEKKKQAALETVAVKPEDVSVTSDAPEAQAEAADAAAGNAEAAGA